MTRPALIAIAILLAVAASAYFMLRSGEPEPEPVAPPAATEPAAVEPEVASEPSIPVPALAESDEFVRGLGVQLGLPDAVTAAVPSDLVTNLVRMVDTVASGEVPRRELGFLAPEGEYPTQPEGDILVVDPAGFARFDRVAAMVDALDARAVVSSYELMEPLLQEAFGDVGGGDMPFRARLIKALDVLVTTPVLEGQPGLVDVAVDRFEYREPQLEALAPAQKQLLRMGPRNQSLIQARLQQIRDLLTPDA